MFCTKLGNLGAEVADVHYAVVNAFYLVAKYECRFLDAREVYPEASFGDMYGNLFLFPELMNAHRANDAAVMEAYGFPKEASEREIVARLFKKYQELAGQ